MKNEADMFTKNLAGPEHNKHAVRLCGHGEYYSTVQDGESHAREGVRSHGALTIGKTEKQVE